MVSKEKKSRDITEKNNHCANLNNIKMNPFISQEP